MGDLRALPLVFDGSVDRTSGSTPDTGPVPASPVWRMDFRGDLSGGWFGQRSRLPADDGFDANSEDGFRRQLRSQLRRVFLLVEQYLLIAKREPERHRLASLVQDIAVDAQQCFVKAALIQVGSRLLSPDQERCIADLEDFLAALGGNVPPTAPTLLHALDGVIVQCVLLDAEPAATSLPQPRLG